MKIDFRILFQEDAIAALARDPVVSRECDLEAVAFDLDAASETFDRVLQLTRDCSGGWFNPMTRFTRRELDTAHPSFSSTAARPSARPTGSTSSTSRASNRPRSESTGEGMRIKLLDRISLARVPDQAEHGVRCRRVDGGVHHRQRSRSGVRRGGPHRLFTASGLESQDGQGARGHLPALQRGHHAPRSSATSPRSPYPAAGFASSPA